MVFIFFSKKKSPLHLQPHIYIYEDEEELPRSVQLICINLNVQYIRASSEISHICEFGDAAASTVMGINLIY